MASVHLSLILTWVIRCRVIWKSLKRSLFASRDDLYMYMYLNTQICFCKTWFIYIYSGNLYLEIWSRASFVSLPHLFLLHKVLFWHEEVCQFINMSQNILCIILFLQQTRHWRNFLLLSIITFYWNLALVILPSNYSFLQDFSYLFRYISDHLLLNIVSPMFLSYWTLCTEVQKLPLLSFMFSDSIYCYQNITTMFEKTLHNTSRDSYL